MVFVETNAFLLDHTVSFFSWSKCAGLLNPQKGTSGLSLLFYSSRNIVRVPNHLPHLVFLHRLLAAQRKFAWIVLVSRSSSPCEEAPLSLKQSQSDFLLSWISKLTNKTTKTLALLLFFLPLYLFCFEWCITFKKTTSIFSWGVQMLQI